MPRVVSQFQHVVQSWRASVGFDPGRRLVEQHHVRGRHERPRELQEFALTTGERAGVGVGVRLQLDEPEELRRDGRRARAPADAHRAVAGTRATGARPVDAAPASITLSRTLICVSAFVSWNVRTSPRCGDPVRPAAVDPLTPEDDPPAVGPVEAGHVVEQRRLAGAVGADQRRDRVEARRRTSRRSPRRAPRTASSRPRPPGWALHRSYRELFLLAEEPLRSERHEADQDQPDDDEADVRAVRRS